MKFLIAALDNEGNVLSFVTNYSHDTHKSTGYFETIDKKIAEEKTKEYNKQLKNIRDKCPNYICDINLYAVFTVK